MAAILVLAGSRTSGADEPIFANIAAWTGPVENTQSIALGDVDGDGDLDLVRGNSRGLSTLYRNTGGSFALAPAWPGPEEGTRTIVLGDVDGDGDLDLVRGNYDRGPTLYLNNGGTFATDTAWMGPPESTYSMALADVDGDGDLDLIRGNVGRTTLYLNAGGMFARTPIPIGPPGNTFGVALGDVDGDGDLDLVRGNYRQACMLHLNQGGRFDSLAAWSGPAENTSSVALGDVDGDGDLDLIRGNLGGGATLYLNDGGTFGSSPIWTGPTESTLSVALGDLDGDGDLDLVRGNDGEGATLYLNIGGIFDGIPAWTGPTQLTYSVALGDVDGDGDLDLVRGNFGQAARLYLNTSGAFASAPGWTAPAAHTTSVVLGDVDGDGDLDLVRGNAGQEATLYLNTGGALAIAPWPGPVENTYSMTLGDVDGDGRLDLVRGNQNQSATLYLNAGGTFGTVPIRTEPAQRTTSVALGDVDGDGRLDLMRGNQDQPAALYRNIGARFDSAAVWTGPREDTRGVALGDVDADGDLDLVRGNFERPATLYLNRGGRLDTTAAWSGPAETTYGVALGDVDGDGKLDLVRGNSGQTTLYLNTGGAFGSAPVWAGLEEETQSVALGDVDGDGDLDLVRGNFRDGTTLYTNTGGTFAFTSSWTGPIEGTRSVALGDIDGDGDLDLVRGNDFVDGNPYETTVYLRKSPWVKTASDSVPRNQLPNNPAHLRSVRVAPSGPNRYRISFQAFDAEADPLWLVGEYQLEGAPTWYPMVLAGSMLRTGPFATSWEGVGHEVLWNVEALPFDRRGVVIRLRADSPPRHAGIIQFSPSYLLNVGRVVPLRPELAASPESIVFPPRTVGDSAMVALLISNPGTQDLVIDRIETADSAISVPGELPLVLAAGGDRALEVLLAPRRGLTDVGALRIHSNDPLRAVVEIPIVVDVRSLVIETRLLAVAPELPLGEAATVIVTPAPLVHVEAGRLYYRPRVAAATFEDTPLVAQGTNFAALIPGERVTEAGVEYYVRVENSGVSTTDPPPGAPDPAFFYPVASPTAFSAEARADTAGDYPAGRPTPIVVTLPQGSRFVNGALYYRPGGTAAYDSLDLGNEISPGVFSPVIPGEDVGTRGLEYWVRVQTLTRTLTLPSTNPKQHPSALRTQVASLSEGTSHAAGRYRLVSVPLELGLPPTATLEPLLSDQPEFGPYDPTRWRSYRYLPERSGYVELSQAATVPGKLRPEPGRGFWLIARAANRIVTAPVVGLSTPTQSPYRIRLEHGWNQIGNPFVFPVAWRDVSFEGAAGAETPRPPTGWDEAAGKYRLADVTMLLPFEGYWIENRSKDPVDLLIPPLEAPSSSPPVAMRLGPAISGESFEDSTGWRFQIIATCGGSDARGFAGISPLADQGWDELDRSDPPPAPGPALSIYFPDADQSGGRLAVDIRPPIPADGDPTVRGQRWIFDVARTEHADPEEARLEFTGLDPIPPDLEVRMIDRALERTVDLRRQREYAYIAGRRDFVADPSQARFELLVGSPEFVESVRSVSPGRPRSTRLLPVYPNPVVAAGAIRFETAVAGRVTLRVFDPAGRRIRTLADRSFEAGLHELAWRRDDDRGRRVAPGLYLVSLVAPDRTDVRKLVIAP